MPPTPHIPADLDWQKATDDESAPEYIEVAFGDDDHVYLRTNIEPDNVVVTTRTKWDAFVLGVKAGEFDHFVGL
ncbi:DUF397 domain-containing protein [Streptomyces albofaciens JCM 4342]|uniref:DUF397 domain-containing protein n=1 Tax=Streptomyces albofaciens TaxID=66866 RepID=UPI00123B4706|nr:DUF397 domain-containing protein [Streptomyces albofaciens]KAA6214704.1 DUF397 domain-containing protein [Streptomyces albofaciens JCM 4342]